MATIKCPRCNGTGRWVGNRGGSGPCYRCNGADNVDARPTGDAYRARQDRDYAAGVNAGRAARQSADDRRAMRGSLDDGWGMIVNDDAPAYRAAIAAPAKASPRMAAVRAYAARPAAKPMGRLDLTNAAPPAWLDDQKTMAPVWQGLA